MIATPLGFSYPSIQSKVSRNTTYVIHQNVGQLHVSILHIMIIRVSPSPPPPTPMAWEPRMDEGLSRFHDHTQTHHTRKDSSGRLISLSQRPLPDNTTFTTNPHVSAGIRTRNPSKRAAANPRLRQRGLRDRRWCVYTRRIETCSCLALRYIIKLCLNWPWTVLSGKES
jgi:hypothetical protein